MLALVALFTGGLLVFSTQAHAVVRRRAQFALLRVLGVTRRRLTLLIVAEGALVGVAGSALGLALGFALAQAAVRWFGADLGSGYFRGVVPTLALEPRALGVFFALGVAAAVAGSFVPAFEAARASPAQALKAGDEERAYAKLRPVGPGLAVMALGAAATTLPPVAGLPLFGYAAIALLLVGTLMLMPRVAVVALRGCRRRARPRRALRIAQLRGAPGQVRVSLAAIVASVSLTVSMVIMVASFRDSLDAWLERILPADVYFRAASGGDTAYLTPDLQAMIAALPGVRRAEFLREQQLLLDPARPRIVLQARTVDPASPARNLPLVGAPLVVARRCAAAGVGERSGGRSLRLRAGTRDRVAARREDRALHRGGRLARLWAPAGRDRDGTVALRRAHRRSHGHHGRAVARRRRRSGRVRGVGPRVDPRRRAARDRATRARSARRRSRCSTARSP